MRPSAIRMVVFASLTALLLLPAYIAHLKPGSANSIARRISLLGLGYSGNASAPRTGTKKAYGPSSLQRLRARILPPAPVALVFVGLLRTFRVPEVRESIITHVYNPLREARHPLHTIFYLGDAKFLTDAMLRPFQPANVSQGMRVACPPRVVCPPDAMPMWRPFIICRTAEAWPLVQRVEQERGRKFGWIYRLRPDIAYLRPLPLPRQLDPSVLHVNTHLPGLMERAYPYLRSILKDSRGDLLVEQLGDHLAIVARPLAPKLFKAVEVFDDCKLRAMKDQINPEIAMSYWLARNRVRVVRHPWFFLLVRGVHGPECKRVHELADSKEEAQSRVTECEAVKKKWMPAIMKLEEAQ